MLVLSQEDLLGHLTYKIQQRLYRKEAGGGEEIYKYIIRKI